MNAVKSIFFSTLFILSSEAFADINFKNDDIFASIGPTKSHLGSKNLTSAMSGYGMSLGFKPKALNLGYISSLSYSSEEGQVFNYYYSIQTWDASVGVLYQTESLKWLRLYPLAGLSYTVVNSNHYDEDELGLSLGIGAQLVIPETHTFIDFNYKKVFLGDSLSAFDSYILYLGIGYQI
ncbi:outer membrane beta-barrel protein [Vibrio rotiferianus]|uniref:outer membrane beta-barrel protein n=1 Tax=Vibrio rotiferianus TaxID=190895 RepID=UPI00406A6D98